MVIDDLKQYDEFVIYGGQKIAVGAILHPDRYDDYYRIMYGKYQYTYNLVSARKEVFDNYCSWFFEITEYMEKTYGAEVPELIETRAFSYVAEVLTNIYFMYHQRDLRIRHVEKEIYA